jgi:glycosyltransferase involved in cell wall biosynthesis
MHLPLVTTVFGEIYDSPGVHRRRIDDVRYVTAMSKAVLSCSNHCASSMQLLGLPPAQPIHYGVDTARFTPENDGSSHRRRLGISEDARVVLFVGRMVEEMGLGTLLASVPGILQANDRNQVLIAGGSGELTPNSRAIEAERPSRVHILENFESADLAGLYASSDVVVAPSTNERACLGLAIIEAMASSKPVVACQVGGTSEVVADGVTGRLVAPSDPAALVDAVVAYLDDASTAHAHGRAGRAVALTRFDLDVSNRRIESLFLDALDRS